MKISKQADEKKEEEEKAEEKSEEEEWRGRRGGGEERETCRARGHSRSEGREGKASHREMSSM